MRRRTQEMRTRQGDRKRPMRNAPRVNQ
jgi:hypothetical protein